MATELHEQRVEADAIEPGMYVSRLDRAWEGTPFPTQGFLVVDDVQVHLLRQWCGHLYIDVRRSVSLDPARMTLEAPQRRRSAGGADLVAVEAEADAAGEAHANAERLARGIIDAVRHGGGFSREDVLATVEPIVRSIVRNYDAFFWIEALRKRDEYAYSHAVSCSALAAALGRHMGFPEPELIELASGGLLMDIGKVALPEDLLGQPGPLLPAQRAVARSHVQHSLRILDEMGVGSVAVRAMVGHHHEAFDGTGYPEGLAGDAIPLFGRMAAVVDAFDAMTSTRPYARAMSRHDALQDLYRHAGKRYQQEVVEQLTQCLGVYPTGSLVELSTGEVALVMSQNRVRQLRPRVILLTGPDKRIDPGFRRIDLMGQPTTADGRSIHILRALQPGAYGIDPTELFL